MTSSGRRPPVGRHVALATVSALVTGITSANDITGRDTFICTAWRAVSCSTADTCENTEAWQLNLPDFVRVDLDESTMGTLPGSNEERVTEIASIVRRDGKLFLNGSQEDRGFTWVMNEDTGEGTLAVASDTTVISLFTVCAATNDLR